MSFRLSSNISLVLIAGAFALSYLLQKVGRQEWSEIGGLVLAGFAVACAAYSLWKKNVTGESADPSEQSGQEREEEIGPLGNQDSPARVSKPGAFEELAAGVCHDLNNYLTSAFLHVNLLKEKGISEAQRHSLLTIEKEIDTAFNIIRNFLSFFGPSKSEKREFISVRDLVEDALDTASVVFETRKQGTAQPIRLDTEVAELFVLGVRDQLNRVVLNLILNAAEAMPKGGQLAVKAQAMDQDVEISVSDTGVGVRPELTEKIFEPFYTTKGGAGKGLGLAVAKSIVEEHGGAITCHPGAGGGSVFTVRIPRAEKAPTEGARTPAPTERLLARVDLKSERILVVDDEPGVLDALSQILRSAGHHVIASSSGEDAILAARQGTFDVVISDVVLPEISGVEVVQRIKRINPQIGVVLITASARAAGLAEAKPSGVDAVVSKPFRAEQLLQAVQKVTRS